MASASGEKHQRNVAAGEKPVAMWQWQLAAINKDNQ